MKIIAFLLFLQQGRNVLGDDEIQCHAPANLVHLKSIYNIKGVTKSVPIDMTNISPYYKNIAKNLKSANTIVGNYYNPQFEQPEPILANPSYTLYLLKAKYQLRLAASACAQLGLQLFIPQENQVTLNLFAKLQAKTPPITNIPAFIRSYGEDLFNKNEEHLTSQKNWIVKQGSSAKTQQQKQAIYDDFNHYPSIVTREGTAETKFEIKYASTDKDSQTTAYDIVCQGPMIPDSRGSAYEENFKRKLNQLTAASTAIAPLFEKQGNIQNAATTTIDGITNAIKLLPSDDLTRLSSLAFKLAAGNYWNEGKISLQTIQEATKLLQKFTTPTASGSYPINVGNINTLKTKLGLNQNDFLNPKLKLTPTGKTTSASDYVLSADVKYEAASTQDELKMFRILPNNYEGKLITHQFLIITKTKQYVSDVDVFEHLTCYNVKYCKVARTIADPKAESCAKFILRKSGGSETDCNFRKYDLPTGYRLKCKTNSNAILASNAATKLEAYCGKANMGHIYTPIGLSYLNTSCKLSLNNHIILPPGKDGLDSPPTFEVPDDDDVVIYSIFGGTTSAIVLVLLILIMALCKSNTGYMCNCFSQPSPNKALSTSLQSIQELSNILSPPSGRFGDPIKPTSIDQMFNIPSPTPSAPEK